MPEISVRNADFSDIPSILELVRIIGRYVSFEDELFSWMALDPQAVVIAESSQSKQIVGACSGMAYGPGRGFMGLYMVREEYRGRGIGTQLWNKAMKHLEDRNIGVRGLESMFSEYRDKRGFLHQPDYVICYYKCSESSLISPKLNLDSFGIVSLVGKGVWPGKPELVANIRDLKSNLAESTTECTLRDIKISYLDTVENIIVQERKDTMESGRSVENLLTEVVSYDRLLHGYDRSFIVAQTLSWRSCKTKIAIINEKVVGYICLRPTVVGFWMISPFYADSEDIAELLLFSVLSDVNFSEITDGIEIRFPDKNPYCLKLIQKYGFRDESLPISTGYNKTCIEVDVSRIYSFHATIFCTE
ncbi:uncharacterized protein LOC118187759 isoform X1 [Stegodyphus dumicola]|uniref:uncharacterized protein LOC118187759 isoform X1 n=1 Tax=Stegodyphus dumicola TaxID=202533 RepID=UPI0015B092A3|nr:uncharacterized protein LOC118187759 isoform X1 [Stegodyphus dumicola]XP_035213925.1 uncharacterized protein LOC118187759 isoform X1 [Stegodyphus dumicola]